MSSPRRLTNAATSDRSRGGWNAVQGREARPQRLDRFERRPEGSQPGVNGSAPTSMPGSLYAEAATPSWTPAEVDDHGEALRTAKTIPRT